MIQIAVIQQKTIYLIHFLVFINDHHLNQIMVLTILANILTLKIVSTSLKKLSTAIQKSR